MQIKRSRQSHASPLLRNDRPLASSPTPFDGLSPVNQRTTSFFSERPPQTPPIRTLKTYIIEDFNKLSPTPTERPSRQHARIASPQIKSMPPTKPTFTLGPLQTATHTSFSGLTDHVKKSLASQQQSTQLASFDARLQLAYNRMQHEKEDQRLVEEKKKERRFGLVKSVVKEREEKREKEEKQRREEKIQADEKRKREEREKEIEQAIREDERKIQQEKRLKAAIEQELKEKRLREKKEKEEEIKNKENKAQSLKASSPAIKLPSQTTLNPSTKLTPETLQPTLKPLKSIPRQTRSLSSLHQNKPTLSSSSLASLNQRKPPLAPTSLSHRPKKDNRVVLSLPSLASSDLTNLCESSHPLLATSQEIINHTSLHQYNTNPADLPEALVNVNHIIDTITHQLLNEAIAKVSAEVSDCLDGFIDGILAKEFE